MRFLHQKPQAAIADHLLALQNQEIARARILGKVVRKHIRLPRGGEAGALDGVYDLKIGGRGIAYGAAHSFALVAFSLRSRSACGARR